MKLLITAIWLLIVTCKCQAAKEKKPLICYHCSSATTGAEELCGEYFNERNIPDELLREHKISIQRVCNSTIDSEHERSVCRKTIEKSTDGKIIVKRFCYYTNKSDSLVYCNQTATDKNNERQLFCEDCETDLCNSAISLARHYWYFLMLFSFYFSPF